MVRRRKSNLPKWRYEFDCPNCGSGEYLHNEDGNRNRFCGQCGKAIAWNEEADK